MGKQFKGIGFYVVIAVIILASIYFMTSQDQTGADYKYKDFIKNVKANEVTSIVIEPSKYVPTGKVTVTLDSAETKTLTVLDVDKVQSDLEANNFTNITISDVKGDSIFITTILPFGIVFILVILVFSFMSNQAGGGGASGNKMMNFGKSRAKMVTDAGKKVNFKGVAGLEEEKEELAEIVDFLKTPKKYIEVGARIPKGVLLVGPPGTGKTLLAKAVAGEAGVPFFSISGSDFVEMFVGVGASRVRDLFEEAKKNAPCIVFIDEIDAVARRRGTGMGGGHDEREQTLNQLLVEMDGFGINEGIIVIAATNRVDILDPAILRPGRFDRKVSVGRPDVKGRLAILEVHTKNKPMGEDVDLQELHRLPLDLQVQI